MNERRQQQVSSQHSLVQSQQSWSVRSVITPPQPSMTVDGYSLPPYIDKCQYRDMSMSDLLPMLENGTCCTPLAREPLGAADADVLAPRFKALADPVRLRLLSLVQSCEGGEACVCDLTAAFDLSQPTISHHLKVLLDAGLLTREKRGVWAFYRVRPETLSALAAVIDVPRPSLT
jgi:ArsR family transcriptional regulator